MVGGTRSVPVLITGCSSGIGRAAAISLHAAGLTVYATARQVDSLAGLARQGIRTLALDVTDEASMTAAVAAIEDAAGPVGVLVNNAGYGLYGPVEQLPMDEIRRQFETNFFGLVRLTQLVLPGMRRRGRGRILNVSSMGGRITLPGGAFYHASKYAVEGLSDALRMEVAQFGIDVVLIEPGPVKTPWNDVAAASLSSAAPASAEGGSGEGVATVTPMRRTRLRSVPRSAGPRLAWLAASGPPPRTSPRSSPRRSPRGGRAPATSSIRSRRVSSP